MKLAAVFANVFLSGSRGDERDLEGGSMRTTVEKRRAGQSFSRSTTTDTADWEFDDDQPGSAVDASATRRAFRSSQSLHSRLQEKISRLKHFILQTDGDAQAELEHLPTYRWLPILSGIIIPFSILLEIPGLTEHWYIVTENNKTVLTKKNSPLLDVGLSISMACALIANIAIIFRFLEKKIRTSTLIAIVALSIHDIINIVAVTIFGVIHRFNDGFTYGQSFWFTVCSTIASFITNISLIVDFVRTPDFARSSSGLTRKQRSLVIVVMILLCWIALGALINSLLLALPFIDGLYFTVVTLETVGFGDIVPHTTGSRVFCAFHSTTGILNLALAVSTARDTVIESFEHSYRKHLAALRVRRQERRAHKVRRRAKKEAIKRQLERAGLPIYIHSHIGGGRALKKKMHLNTEALSPEQRADAFREALLNTERLLLERSTTFGSHLTLDLEVSETLQKEFAVKLTVAWVLFLTFWLIGSAIFMATEGWSFGLAMWFCFVSFSTIGFGDFTPETPAGRSVFIVWAMLGVGTMTILISVLGEAYSSRYQKALQTHASHRPMVTTKNISRPISTTKPFREPLVMHARPRHLRRRTASCPHLEPYRVSSSSSETAISPDPGAISVETRVVQRDGLKNTEVSFT